MVLVEKGASPIVVSDTVNSKNTVSNWQNTGVVYATGMYAGGISGYNTGSLLENLDTSGAVTVAGEYPVSHAADYVGGITGYNHGVIKAEARKDNNVRIVGKNYVGGIVGYNDSSAEVTNYAVTAGSINGDTDKGSYVGGLAGCNASILMLQKADGSAKQLYVSTQNISGKYFVGGVIGANIINTNGYNQNMITEPGQSGSTDTATDSSAGNTTKLCYLDLSVETIWGSADSPTVKYNIQAVNDSDKEISDWYVKIHVQQNVLIDKQLWGWQLPVEEVEDSEKSEIIYVLRPDDLKIAANNKSRSRSFVLTFKSYQEAYSFDITDIEFYYTGGDGNKTVLKPGNNNITEKNIHEVIGTGEGEYQLKLTGGKTTIWVGQLLTVYQITNVQFLNNSEYDAFDWYVKIPVENELSIHFDQWNANSMNKEYVEEIGEDGKANNYWKLSPKTVTRIAKKSSSENYQMMFYSEDDSVYN